MLLLAAAVAICVPPQAACDAAGREKIPAPRIDAKVAVASATRAPWIVHNAWRYRMKPGAPVLVEPEENGAALATAEALAFDGNALIRTPSAEEARVRALLAFDAAPSPMPDVADVRVAGQSKLLPEVLNLLSRRNLLYSLGDAPGAAFTVELGKGVFTEDAARDPHGFAALVRSKLTDDRRSLRLYGTELTLARLQGDGRGAQLRLVNYGSRSLEGVRIRVRGSFKRVNLRAFGYAGAKAEELRLSGGFTEFSIPEMREYAVVDLE